MTPNIIAAYLRLSKADRDRSEKDESNSITNQRSLIKNYLITHPDLATMDYQEFVDDGYTGTTTMRPAFKKLISLAKAGRIQTIIVKDLSRFSRDYLLLGDYIEQIFPMIRVRFISINDHYDSKSSDSYLESMNTALQSLVYSYYVKDLSKKRAAGVEYRMKNGTFIGPAPYGYVTDWENHCYRVDPDAASVVRMIYSFAAQGMKKAAIANCLNEQHIMTPAQYNAAHPQFGKVGHKWQTAQPLWDYSKVSNILDNPVYLGHLEHRKNLSRFTEHPGTAPVPKGDRIIRKNAHDAIISQELFDAAHEALNQKYGKSKFAHKKYPPLTTPLVGKLTCGYCGMKLRFRTNAKYAYCKRSQLQQSICPATNFPLDELETYILCQIQSALRQLLLAKETAEAEVRLARERIKPCQLQLSRSQEQLISLQDEKRRNFEALASGTITIDAFSEQKEHLQQDADALQAEISTLQAEEIRLVNSSVPEDIKALAETAKAHLSEEKLTKEILQTYVDTVVVHDIGKYEIRWRHEALFSKLLANSENRKENNL